MGWESVGILGKRTRMGRCKTVEMRWETIEILGTMMGYESVDIWEEDKDRTEKVGEMGRGLGWRRNMCEGKSVIFEGNK